MSAVSLSSFVQPFVEKNIGVRTRLSAPRVVAMPDAAVALLTRPVVRVVQTIDLSGSMKDYHGAVLSHQRAMLGFLKNDPAVVAALLLALGVMSGPAQVGGFATVDGVDEPPHTPGQWSEIGGMAKSVADAFQAADVADRATGVIVRKRHAFVVTDGVPSDEPAAQTAAGFAALAQAARDLDITVQVIGVPNSNAENLKAMSHGTTPIQLDTLDIDALYAWLGNTIRTVSVRRPGPAADLGTPAGPARG